MNIDETDKNLKHEEVFDRLINQLPPDNDTVCIDHDKKNNKFKVRRETLRSKGKVKMKRAGSRDKRRLSS